MPKYQNDTAVDITVPSKTGYLTFAPSQEIEVDFFIPDEYGLTLTNDLPRVDPQILAAGNLELYNGQSHQILVPKCKAFMASLVCKNEKAEVRESYEDAAITSPCDTLNMFRSSFRRVDVDSLWVTGTGDDAKGPAYISYLVSRLS